MASSRKREQGKKGPAAQPVRDETGHHHNWDAHERLFIGALATTLEGKGYTVGEVRTIINELPPGTVHILIRRHKWTQDKAITPSMWKKAKQQADKHMRTKPKQGAHGQMSEPTVPAEPPQSVQPMQVIFTRRKGEKQVNIRTYPNRSARQGKPQTIGQRPQVGGPRRHR